MRRELVNALGIVFIITAILAENKAQELPGTETPEFGWKVVELKDFPSAPSKGALSAIVARLAFRERQDSRTGGGISLVITIENRGEQKVRFNNPIDFMSISLADQDGWPIDLPSVRHRITRESRDDHGAKAHELPYKLVRVNRDGLRMTKKEIEERVFDLPAKAKVQLHILVDRIVEKPLTAPARERVGTGEVPASPLKIVEVPRKALKLKVAVRLYDPDDRSVMRQLECPYMPVCIE